MDEKRLSELEKKWLDGSITTTEAEEYAQWYNADQNKPIIIPDDIARSREEHQLRILDNIINKLEEEENIKNHTNNTKRRYYAIAASIILCLGLGGLWLYHYNKDKRQEVEFADKAPGVSGLIITLNDGKEIQIDSIPDGIIATQDGISIIKKNGAIHYEGNTNVLAYNTASTKKGRTFELILPDQSKVWLNAASKLKYPVAFTGNQREVELNGEAYFEVHHDAKQPFVVHAGQQKITVLGTNFNINNYDDENQISTTLIEGKVNVEVGKEKKTIQPNHQAVSMNHDASIKVIEVDASQSISWINGQFNFDNSDLRTILNQIARWYDVEVEISPTVNQFQKFYGSTSMNQNLSEVLKVLELSGIHLKLEGNKLTVKP